MLGNANFSSIYRENRWMLAIGTYFSKDHVLDIDLETTTCVFRVPKPSTGADAPRRLGLGPYHHLRPEFYNMQLHKISRLRRFLGPEKLDVFKKVVAALVRCEPLIRACYDEFLDFDIKTLATILAVDALYLLHYFFDARKNDEIADEMSMMMENAGDILMVENQIPLALLKVILEILQLHEIIGGSPERRLSAEFLHFCGAHSPLELTQRNTKKHLHLLDCMYQSIVMNRGDDLDQISMGCGFADDVATILGFSGFQKAASAQILAIVERAKKIRDQLRGGEAASDEEAAASCSPTASELSRTTGVRFERTPGGIMDTMYYVDRKILQLTRIRVDSNSEIVLRNLVAYEAASARAGALRWLAEYVDLMCGMIRANEDVHVLKKAGIIAGELSDEEIVGVFDGIRKSAGCRGFKQSNINAQAVEKTYDDVGCVRVKRFVKKGLSLSWKIISLVFAVAALLILVLQAFCSVFACDRWFRRSAPVQAFPFLYADH